MCGCARVGCVGVCSSLRLWVSAWCVGVCVGRGVRVGVGVFVIEL